MFIRPTAVILLSLNGFASFANLDWSFLETWGFRKIADPSQVGSESYRHFGK